MITADIQQLAPGKMVELFEIDATALGANHDRFHGYPEAGSIWWQGNEYFPWAIEAEGFSKTGDARQPTPTLRVGNIGQDEQGNPIPGIISSLCLAYQDLVGAVVTRRRTLVKYLDAVNFPGGNPEADPDEEMTPEIWRIEQKTAEDNEVVEFQLSTPLDFTGEKLPNRQIMANMCSWLIKGGYRGAYCGYTGSAMFDADDNPVSDPSLDRCGGRLTSCKLRFGQTSELNFGGYPSADRLR